MKETIMGDRVPIPAPIWRKLLAFIKDERSGTIELKVRRGQVRNAIVSEEVTAPPSQGTVVLHSRR
jgi:hypothetical protein